MAANIRDSMYENQKKYVSENVTNKQWLCGYWKLILLCMKCGKGRTVWGDREGRCNKMAEII